MTRHDPALISAAIAAWFGQRNAIGMLATSQASTSHENAVATPAITAALYARFVSRQDDAPAMKAIAAMRNQFGGHALHTEPPASGDASAD